MEKLLIKLNIKKMLKVIEPCPSGTKPLINKPKAKIISAIAINFIRENLSAKKPKNIPENAIIYIEVPINIPNSPLWSDNVSVGHIILDNITILIKNIEAVKAQVL